MEINLNDYGIKQNESTSNNCCMIPFDKGYTLVHTDNKLKLKKCDCPCHKNFMIKHMAPCCVFPDKNNILHFEKYMIPSK